MTLSRVTFIRMTFRKMTFSRMTFSKMTFSKMTLSGITLGRMMLYRMTLRKMTISRMTLSRMSFSRIIIRTMSFSVKVKKCFAECHNLDIVLSGVMLIVVMLSVIMQSTSAPEFCMKFQKRIKTKIVLYFYFFVGQGVELSAKLLVIIYNLYIFIYALKL